MTEDELAKTSVGERFLENKDLSVDAVLDYLLALQRCRYEHILDPTWVKKYDLEIEATKEILKILTQ